MPSQHPPHTTAPKTLWSYAFFNLTLLVLLAAWLWYRNQPVTMPEPQLPADKKLQCVSYSPYYGKKQTPFLKNYKVPKAQIDRDMELLSQRFECVRIYSVGQGLDYVPEAASKVGLKVYLGAWIGWVKADNDKEFNLAIKLANQYPDVVKAVIIGNEVLLRREQTPAVIQSYLERAQSATQVPVTYADVWEFWLKNKSLEKSVDFVTIHILPYWEDDPQPIENAVSHTSNVMQRLSTVFSKPLLIGETGWPSMGRQRGPSIPSQLNQASYMRQFIGEAHAKNWNYNLIEAMDQPWKRVLEGTMGGYWGLYGTDLKPKFDWNGPLSERNDDCTPLYWAIGGVLIWAGLALYRRERRASAWLAMSLLGVTAGISGMLQIAYLETAARDVMEWLALGSIVVVGWAALIAITWLYTSPISGKADRIMRLCLGFLLAGAAIAGWLLMTDGRYRDFPLVLYALPVLQLSIGMSLAGRDTRTAWRPFYVINGIAVVSVIACIVLEPINLSAWLWAALTVLLTFASWPKHSAGAYEKT